MHQIAWHWLRNIGLLLICTSLLVACATPRLTYSNFAKIEKGMTEQQVLKILGEPDDVTKISVGTGDAKILGIKVGALFGIDDVSGTNMVWKNDKAKANVIFVKNKVYSTNYTNQF